MVAQTHPFKKIPERNVPWDGVKAPDPMRDDPEHPYSKFGPDGHKNSFHDGGVIPGGPNSGGGPQIAPTGPLQTTINPGSVTAQAGALGFGSTRGGDRSISADIRAQQAAMSRPPQLAGKNRFGRQSNRSRKLADRVKQTVGQFKDGGKIVKKGKKKQTTGTKDLTAKTAGPRLRGRELQRKNAERAAEGLPPLKK